MTRQFAYGRRYVGPVRAVIFDWAGTTVDFGCLAPASVFQRAFADARVAISTSEVRRPMGLEKRDHIRMLLDDPSIAVRWQQAHGTPSGEDDIDRMYRAFIPLQLACLADHADLVPGTRDCVARLRDRGIKIGSNTGYSREMMEVLAPEAARRGYIPDSLVCATDVPAARPGPFMLFRNLEELGVWPAEASVKVDDTVPGIEEGLNAGAWTVGVAASGNQLGLSAAQFAALDDAERDRLVARAADTLYRAGAHFVCDTVADLPPVIDQIEGRLARGERP